MGDVGPLALRLIEMKAKLGPNERCPCGSGKKVKKCCRVQRLTGYTTQDREAVFAELEFLMDELLADAEEEAYELLWGPFYDREDEVSDEIRHLSDDVQMMWFACDFELEPGRTALDVLLEKHPSLSPGARAFALRIRRSAVHLYEVASTVPGVSITLRDVLEGGTVTVAERTASKSVNQFDWLAARVVAPGASGEPEMERGVMMIPRMFHRDVHSQLTGMRSDALSDGNLAGFYKGLPPFFHEVWVGSIIEPRIPALHNTDGEPMLMTRAHFEIRGREELERALDACDGLEREGEGWSWAGPNARGQVVSLGRFELGSDSLVIEANSKARAERGMALIASVAADTVSHRATTHEDLARRLRNQLKADAVGQGFTGRSSNAGELDRLAFGSVPDQRSSSFPGGARAPQVPPEITEALVLDHYAKHYRGWVDEPVPALDDLTPRAAAKRPAMRGRVVELIQGLESMYQQALRAGAPAYDPSWMWDELQLKGGERKHPPPLPHERLAHFIEGAGGLVSELAESERQRPGFDDRSSLIDETACVSNLSVQRLLKANPPLEDREAPAFRRRELRPYIEQALNFALHRRKAFWVDESLAYMLSQTDVDIAGVDLRAPFPAFALVFTDRHVLSLGERLLSRRSESALSGLILRIVTVYVMERVDDAGRVLDLCFAFDALGDDLPELVHHRLLFADHTPVQSLFPQEERTVLLDPPIKITSPLHGLLQVVVNTLLYATSAGAEPQARPGEGTQSRQQGSARGLSSEDVYFLPGAIDISQVRKFEELSRVREGREILRRYMVRGHWRKAAKNWSDPRMRWIAPYWKGPDMAAVIERAYRLRE